nr:DnaB-like helicase C-terminal domain-containing protein [uncultured Draconibacterium sp.]
MIKQLNIDKVPPNAIEVEEVVLGAMILEPDCYINNPVKKVWFYKEEHQIIISCISELVSKSIRPDMVQVTTRLRDQEQLDKIGGPGFITKLTNQVASSANIEHHIRIIRDKYSEREMLRFSHEVINKLNNPTIDIEDVYSFMQDELSKVMSYDSSDSSSSFADAAMELIKDLQSGIEPGIKTGFAKYDSFTGGFHNSDLIIIAGETSQGKTSLATSALRNIVNSGIPAAVFSTEMTKKQIVARMIAQETGIGAKQILYNRLSSERREYVIQELINTKNQIYFDDQSNNDVDKICTSIRKLKIKRNIGIVLVDFIQDLKGADTETGVAEIGRKLKNIAKELDIPVIAISQLSRDRNNPKPSMSRLRGSGQLEEKADIIMLLWRPEYYNMNFPEPFTGESTKDTAQIIIGKGRNVGIGSFLLKFNKETTGFYDHAPEYENELSRNPNERIESNQGDCPY